MISDELYKICFNKKKGLIKETWAEIHAKYDNPFKTCNSLRNTFEKQIKKENTDGIRKINTEDKTGSEEIKPIYEDLGDYYNVYDNNRKVKITKDQLRTLKGLYCDDKPLTINQICRTMDIPRRDFVLIKNAFSITHDDVPFIDEDIVEENIDQLVENTLEKRKEKYFIKLQQREIEDLKKELGMFRKKDYFLLKMQDLTKDFLNKPSTIKIEPITFNNSQKNGKLLEVPIVDLHLNKLAWNQETGEDYDSKIAAERFKYTIMEIKNKVVNRKYERVIFPIGNDFFNIDNPAKTTTGGTPQDSDSRWAKMFMTGVELLTWGITQLEEIAPVYAFLVPGNHDFTTSFYAICTVAMYFKDSKDVIIDTNPQSRKYVWFGNNLIGFTHMDKEGIRLQGNMQVEAPEAWGKTKYREWHGGHLHSEQTREIAGYGIKIRNLTSPTASDFWHTTSGYIGSIAETQIFTWDKQLGLDQIEFVIIESQIKKHIIQI